MKIMNTLLKTKHNILDIPIQMEKEMLKKNMSIVNYLLYLGKIGLPKYKLVKISIKRGEPI